MEAVAVAHLLLAAGQKVAAVAVVVAQDITAALVAVEILHSHQLQAGMVALEHLDQ